ncbi:MAG: LytTR family transcriptional regulator DNA-binding domain-containing protein, partial [Eubacterium sp.]|nr:LytTR family transcriptional regulator DNA-binding domain-containing protein [Eubacterium sp.]
LRFVMDKSSSKRQLLIKVEGEETLINVSDIIYLEAQNQYVMIYTVSGEFLVRYNIGDFEEQLKNDGFFRVHRGYLISLARVKKMVKGDVLLDGNDGDVSVPVSRSNIKPLKEALYSYVESSAF